MEGRPKGGGAQRRCLRGANDGCDCRRANNARGGACRGARAGCEEGKADGRVGERSGGGARGSAYGGASSYDNTHDVLTRVDNGSLDSGEGGSQGSQNDLGNGRSDGTRRAHPRGTDRGSARANVWCRRVHRAEAE
jgi:hypothetical protein